MSLISRKAWFGIVAVVCALFIALVLCELALRIFEPSLLGVTDDAGQASVIQPDGHLGMVLLPNSPGQDAWGFKNASVPSTTDMLAIGDSHTYGVYQGPDWPMDLAHATGKSVYNMGIWGYGPAQYSTLLQKGLTLTPKTIIIALFLGNDIFDSYDVVYHDTGWEQYQNPAFADNAPKAASSIKQLSHIPLQALRDYLRSHLALYTLLGNSTRNIREYLGFASPRTVGTKNWATKDPDASLIFDRGGVSKTLFWAGGRLRGVDLSSKEVEEGLRLTQRFMLEMAQASSRAGARAVFVLVPEKESVYADAVQTAGLSNTFYDEVVSNESSLRSRILELCTAHSLSCLDLLPALSADVSAGKALYPDTWDDHPTPAGYQAYADAIAGFLSKKL